MELLGWCAGLLLAVFWAQLPSFAPFSAVFSHSTLLSEPWWMPSSRALRRRLNHGPSRDEQVDVLHLTTWQFDAGSEVVGAYVRHVDDDSVVGTPAAVEAMLRDEEPEEQTAPQTVARRFDDHRERLVIHPGWTLKAPPIQNRDLIPDWGGPEALLHQRMPPSLTADKWYIDRRRGVLTRFHAVARQRLCVPSKQGIPNGVEWAELSRRRRTLAICKPMNAPLRFEDRFGVKNLRPGRNLEMLESATSWTGRTEFELVPVPRAGAE